MTTQYYPIPRDYVEIKNDNPTMWDGYRFGRPTDYHLFFEDFTKFTAADWTLTKVGTGTVIVGQLRGGQISMTNSGADNDNLNLALEQASGVSNASFFPLAGKAMYFEARFAQQTDDTQSDIFIGLAAAGTTDAVGTPPTNGIFFRKDDGDTQIDFVTSKAAVSSTDANIGTFVADTFFTVGFRLTGTSLVEYYVNGVKKGSFGTNIPTTGFNGLMPCVNIQNGEAAAKRLFVDYIFVAQER